MASCRPDVIRRIHHFFFDFGDGKTLSDFPIFVESKAAWSSMRGWEYTLWNETTARNLVETRRPEFLDTYDSFKYPIQRLDVAKYLVAHHIGGFVVDLDIVPLPKVRVDDILGRNSPPYLFDRCTRKGIVANDIFYVGVQGLPGIFDDLASNKARLDKIEAYKCRKMRYAFHSTGPDFLSRYLKATGLHRYCTAISQRTFLDPKQAHRNVSADDPKVRIVHHLSWASQLSRH